jgi:hypothetical protein
VCALKLVTTSNAPTVARWPIFRDAHVLSMRGGKGLCRATSRQRRFTKSVGRRGGGGVRHPLVDGALVSPYSTGG